MGKQFGYTLSEEIFRLHYGKPWSKMIEEIFPGLPFTQFYSSLMELEKDHPFEEIDGTTSLLQYLQLLGIKIGILTSDYQESFLRRANYLGHLQYIETQLIFCADNTLHQKPDGRVFIPVVEYLEAVGIKKEEIAFVGDLLTDYQAAKEANILFFAVTTGYKTKEDFLEAGLSSSHILSSVVDLRNWFSSYETPPENQKVISW